MRISNVWKVTKRLHLGFLWYNMGVGVFWNGKKKYLMIFLLPTLGIMVRCARLKRRRSA